MNTGPAQENQAHDNANKIWYSHNNTHEETFGDRGSPIILGYKALHQVYGHKARDAGHHNEGKQDQYSGNRNSGSYFKE